MLLNKLEHTSLIEVGTQTHILVGQAFRTPIPLKFHMFLGLIP